MGVDIFGECDDLVAVCVDDIDTLPDWYAECVLSDLSSFIFLFIGIHFIWF